MKKQNPDFMLYLAWPLYDPHGSVQSGLLSMSKYHMQSAIRRKFPVSSAFISKFTDLDRCFTVMHYPIKGGKELIVINSHMSAYDRGGKIRSAMVLLFRKILRPRLPTSILIIATPITIH
ncbi:MAG: hypothetical protein ACIRZI_01955 [Lactobacillus gallinarum]|uniref:hypothetical protein n=1 Tax=Lactobacillus gallinarum TaxID=52242 RepID=UPI003817BDBE